MFLHIFLNFYTNQVLTALQLWVFTGDILATNALAVKRKAVVHYFTFDWVIQCKQRGHKEKNIYKEEEVKKGRQFSLLFQEQKEKKGAKSVKQ